MEIPLLYIPEVLFLFLFGFCEAGIFFMAQAILNLRTIFLNTKIVQS
jgi:hypothetical protein